jgi:hypothetical protein
MMIHSPEAKSQDNIWIHRISPLLEEIDRSLNYMTDGFEDCSSTLKVVSRSLSQSCHEDKLHEDKLRENKLKASVYKMDLQ